jgi:Protein of unknown function (DUF3562)
VPPVGNRVQPDEVTITTLARQTDTNRELVRHLYDEEIAALRERATVKNFIGVIAGRRVKQRLRALRGGSTAAPRQVNNSTPA